jgi:nitroimidazol reductase NimA-like FMN-containing flavoprotein (pyridoxamine 5'-phosphate oxidase superfamily)
MDNNHDVVTELPELDCWELLRQEEFGRLAFHLVNEVHIVPINYVVHRGRLVFRTAEGSKLLGITMNQDVAFEIDHYDKQRAVSVVVRGTARELQGEEADQAEHLPLRPWVPTAKFSIVEIKPVEVTGRLFRLDRPWTDMRPTGTT